MAKQNKPSLGTTIRQSSSGVLAALMCIVIGLVIGLIALFIINPEHALVDGFWRILQGGFYDFPYGCGKVLTQTAPLIMTGLCVQNRPVQHWCGRAVHAGRFRRFVLCHCAGHALVGVPAGIRCVRRAVGGHSRHL